MFFRLEKSKETEEMKKQKKDDKLLATYMQEERKLFLGGKISCWPHTCRRRGSCSSEVRHAAVHIQTEEEEAVFWLAAYAQYRKYSTVQLHCVYFRFG